MQDIHILKTSKTPEVVIKPEKGYMLIKGRSYPEDVREFYNPLIEKIKEVISYWLTSLVDIIEVHLKMDYFNSSSAKFILDTLTLIKTLEERGKTITIYWYTNEDDIDMIDAGEELAELLEHEFIFVDNDIFYNETFDKLDISEYEIKIFPTDKTPKVILDIDKAYLLIEGISYPENADSFYASIMRKLKAAIIYWKKELAGKDKRPKLYLKINYLNSSSSKYIYGIIQMFKDIKKDSTILPELYWYYDDEDSEDIGKELEELSGVEFTFVEADKIEPK